LLRCVRCEVVGRLWVGGGWWVGGLNNYLVYI